MNDLKDSIIGIIPFNAVIKSLDDCILTILDHRGKTPKKLGGDWVETGIPAISAKNIHSGELDNQDSIRFVTEDIYNKWMKEDVQIGDCFLVSEGATLGEYLFWDENYPIVLSQRLFCIRANPEILYPKYFYAYMTTSNFQTQVKGLATGSSVDGLRQVAVRKLLIPTLPMDEQIFIGDLIYSFNKNKKELQTQNKTLETTAQTIFKEWFGKYKIDDELPEGWRVGKLSDFGKIICGKTPSKSNIDFYGSEYPFIKIPDMHNQMFIINTIDNLSLLGANSQKNKIIPANSICVSCIATVGLVSLTTKDSQTNQQINTIVPNDKYLREYIYLKLSKMTKYLNDLGSGGTATLNVNTSTFSNIEVVIPKEQTLKEFNNIVCPIFEKTLSNLEQIQTLKKTRDTLLPKLMSGQVRVNGFKK